jgi:uncharacterized protein (TIGR03067 family)
MRIYPSILLLFFVGCIGSKHAGTTHLVSADLEGTWYPLSEEIAGKPLPLSAFGAQRLTLHDSTYTLQAESPDKGIVRYQKSKMDIYGTEGPNAGKHITAIYKYENGQLTICYNLKGDSYPESFQTEGKPLYFMAVFKKTTIVTAPSQKTNAPVRQVNDAARY